MKSDEVVAPFLIAITIVLTFVLVLYFDSQPSATYSSVRVNTRLYSIGIMTVLYLIYRIINRIVMASRTKNYPQKNMYKIKKRKKFY